MSAGTQEGRSVLEPMDRADPWDYPTLADAYDNALAALTKAEQERDEAVKRAEAMSQVVASALDAIEDNNVFRAEQVLKNTLAPQAEAQAGT